MTLPIYPLQQADEPNALGPFMEGVTTLIDEFWWALVLLTLLLVVRAYIDHSEATQGDASQQGVMATGLFFLSTGYGLVLTVGAIVLGIIANLASILPKLLPMVGWGLGSGDPVTLGAIAASIVAGFAAFDMPWATLSNTILAFAGVAIGLVLLDSLQSASEAVDDDDEDD